MVVLGLYWKPLVSKNIYSRGVLGFGFFSTHSRMNVVGFGGIEIDLGWAKVEKEWVCLITCKCFVFSV